MHQQITKNSGRSVEELKLAELNNLRITIESLKLHRAIGRPQRQSIEEVQARADTLEAELKALREGKGSVSPTT